jgi:manganese-dependent ADP-ribose/CDP-alcohol diphosphatase
MKKGPDRDSQISFGLLADLQYCNSDPAYNRFFKNSPDKLRKALNEFGRHKLDFIIQLGDLIDHDEQSFQGILPLFDQVKVPLYHVLGNHDYEVSEAYKTKVPDVLSTDRFYNFKLGNWRFIVLDGNEISTFANNKNSENYKEAEKILTAENKPVNANFWNGGIGKKQLKWLNSILEDASENDENVMIFCHYPIFPSHRHNLLNDKEVLELIGKYHCVKAWFNGHNHNGNYGQSENIHFINMKGMVETENKYAFSVVTLGKPGIIIDGYGSECSAKLSF